MSGTSLVILAMYSTVNVVGPAGLRISPAGHPYVLALLICAATLTLAAMLAVGGGPARVVPKGPVLPRAKRRFGGPRVRRM